MKIGIIIHSFTGNTLSVAQKLREKLTQAGHSVNIERIKAVGEIQQTFKDFQLDKLPEINQYEALIFAAPVRAFSLSPVMKAFLSQLPRLAGKKVACFVTHAFPFDWMGGNQAIVVMKKICESKGAEVKKSGIVSWSSGKREKQIDHVVEDISRAL